LEQLSSSRIYVWNTVSAHDAVTTHCFIVVMAIPHSKRSVCAPPFGEIFGNELIDLIEK
jgi:hypothetical protein